MGPGAVLAKFTTATWRGAPSAPLEGRRCSLLGAEGLVRWSAVAALQPEPLRKRAQLSYEHLPQLAAKTQPPASMAAPFVRAGAMAALEGPCMPCTSARCSNGVQRDFYRES